jgi:general secretion pathway protein E
MDAMHDPVSSLDAARGADTADAAPRAGDVALLPYGFARNHGVLPLARASDADVVCFYRPDAGLVALVEAQRAARPRPLRLNAVSAPHFQALLRRSYEDSAAAAADSAAANDDLAALAEDAASVDDLLEMRDDAPVVRLINALLAEAVKEGASDVHIECEEKRVSVRFRQDGVLREALQPKRSLAPLLASRIKVMARLDIAEKRLPQDGRISLRIAGREVDVRVSTLPSQYGERVVMRLLDRDAARLELDALGMSGRDHAVFIELIARPHGIILITGPTGSGKTTTLYAALNRLNDGARNILTVEDPIEYALAGIGQTQVNARAEMTFARGLRALLRQDPDVIMVGEIRDRETAEVAIQASMTGHLVLSTLHTNSAVASVARLIDMGIERFLLASSLIGVTAQRLVRRLCPDCRRPAMATAREAAPFGGLLPEGCTIYHPVGCPACRGLGYRGRVGLYETVAIDATLAALIHDGASEAALTEAARRSTPSLLADGVARAREGITSLSEILRVAAEA